MSFIENLKENQSNYQKVNNVINSLYQMLFDIFKNTNIPKPSSITPNRLDKSICVRWYTNILIIDSREISLNGLLYSLGEADEMVAKLEVLLDCSNNTNLDLDHELEVDF